MTSSEVKMGYVLQLVVSFSPSFFCCLCSLVVAIASQLIMIIHAGTPTYYSDNKLVLTVY